MCGTRDRAVVCRREARSAGPTGGGGDAGWKRTGERARGYLERGGGGDAEEGAGRAQAVH